MGVVYIMGIKCVPEEKQYVIRLNPSDLYAYTLSQIQRFGFEYFFFRLITHLNDTHLNAKNITNYSNELVEYYRGMEVSGKDPLVSHCQHSIDPIIWDESVFKSSPELWKYTQAHGLNYGWTQAVHDTLGRTSILSMARYSPAITKEEFDRKRPMCCGCAINCMAPCSPSVHPNKGLNLLWSVCRCAKQRC